MEKKVLFPQSSGSYRLTLLRLLVPPLGYWGLGIERQLKVREENQRNPFCMLEFHNFSFPMIEPDLEELSLSAPWYFQCTEFKLGVLGKFKCKLIIGLVVFCMVVFFLICLCLFTCGSCIVSRQWTQWNMIIPSYLMRNFPVLF